MPPKYDSHLQSTIHTSKVQFTPPNPLYFDECGKLWHIGRNTFIEILWRCCKVGTPPNTKINWQKGVSFFGECVGVQNACKIWEMFWEMFAWCISGNLALKDDVTDIIFQCRVDSFCSFWAPYLVHSSRLPFQFNCLWNPINVLWQEFIWLILSRHLENWEY